METEIRSVGTDGGVRELNTKGHERSFQGVCLNWYGDYTTVFISQNS